MKTLAMGQLELGQEVKVTFNSGRVLEGKVMDFSRMQTQCWIENEVDIYHVNMHHATVELVEQEQEEERAPEGLLTLKELKGAIADELKGQWYEEIESVKVAVYNSDEDGAEVYDCEVQIVLDNGDSIYPTFGTFYNEKDALKHARDMRTKLKRTYDITDKVWVYSC
ncbi:hypothetical protein PHRODO_286 [Bacillus phage Phrodo]|uniref:hypothetical protein n=1 Tax=Bacillus phage Phrodo TaxID=1805953 RepID=UPI0007A770B4|nr:hypothetical protein BI003_gp001 [Bacillus phage Phrodo]YP_009290165.1 hypothetical protein BI003_gp286 [Bacillus phage Phrodo]AMW62049.1 hypothetical protein PHRODO_1 [Bacillus phage Phrodo]AMW62325.1 hypothetical protein PHRODO_286 [Bacillus phage Phrodo]